MPYMARMATSLGCFQISTRSLLCLGRARRVIKTPAARSRRQVTHRELTPKVENKYCPQVPEKPQNTPPKAA